MSAKRKAREELEAKKQEQEQMHRQKEVAKEIKMRQKQVFWKQQCCIIIKQGGHKYRMTEQIKKLAHKKWVQEVKALTQKGCGSSDLKKELQRRMTTNLNTQKEIKGIMVHPRLNGEEHMPRNSREFVKFEKLVNRLSETSEKQEQVIRKLAREIKQQKVDFGAFNQRVIDDKKQIYRELEDLICENEKLTRTLMEQEVEAKQVKSERPQRTVVYQQKKHRQLQQAPVVNQEIHDLGNSISSKIFGREKFPSTMRVRSTINRSTNL